MSIMQITQTIHIVPTLPGRTSKQVQQQTLPGMEPEVVPTRVTNRQIAEVLAGIAELLESQKANPYRIQAYRNGARGVLELPEAAADILARGEPLHIPGVGPRLRAHIAELVQLGTVTFQNGLCLPALPAAVRILMTVEHIGPYTATRLYEELGIETIEQLWWAAQQQRIRKLPGFGVRSEARLQEAAGRLLPKQKPLHIGGAA